MTIEEAIRNRERCLQYLEGCGPMATPENVEAVRLSLVALREKAEREKIEPLTLDELRQMDGEPVYVSDLRSPKNSEYCIIHANDKYGYGDKYRCAQIAGCECFWYSFEEYGERWIAYRHEPKEAEA